MNKMPILAFSRDAVASFISIVRFRIFLKLSSLHNWNIVLRGTQDHTKHFTLTQAMTRADTLSDSHPMQGYLYFLLHYSRSYQKLFSENVTDDPGQITYLTHTAIQGFSLWRNAICQWKRNFFAVYCPISTIYNVE